APCRQSCVLKGPDREKPSTAGGSEAANVADFGNKGGGDKERHASEGLISRRHGGHGPGRYDVTQLLLQSGQPSLRSIDRLNLILKGLTDAAVGYDQTSGSPPSGRSKTGGRGIIGNKLCPFLRPLLLRCSQCCGIATLTQRAMDNRG